MSTRILSSLVLAAALTFSFAGLRADVIVQGTITTTTWEKALSPYIVVADATVPAEHTLTIEAGCEVIVGANRAIRVDGGLIAEGTSNDRIVFRSSNKNDPNQRWRWIELYYPSTTWTRFEHCEFDNAQRGLHFTAWGQGAAATVSHCVFRRCSEAGIVGASYGRTGLCHACPTSHAHLDLAVSACTFEDSARGCWFWIQGEPGPGWPQGRGSCTPRIQNCIFRSMSHAALQLDTVGDLDWLNDSKTAFTNNTIHGSPFGVLTTFPYDVEVRSNIFCDTDVAVSRGGDPAYSGQVTHNCFFDNGADFSGYPSTYGTPIWPNHRGIPADLSYNIFEDPRFVDEESFLLAPDSPCVDSGCDTSNCPAELYFDVCVPPSRGTSINDIGAYGGPGACTLIPPTAVDTPFLRGDSDFDTDIQITDAIFVLGFLFLGKPSATTCAKAFDADDNAFIEITDAVWLLRYAFSGGDAPPAPFLACGSDPTNDALPCADYPPCT